MDAVHADLSPNLSPNRREALILTPLPAIKAAPFPSPSRGGLGRGGKGLGVRFFALYTRVTENCYIFPDSSHVQFHGLTEADDREIWEFAKAQEFCIVTQDADFAERSRLYGSPPKVIWLRCGNASLWG